MRASDKPFDAYAQPGTDRIAWLGQVCAAANTPVDYEGLAQRFDEPYASAQDAFAQRDALTAFKTKLDAAIASAKINPYVVVPRFVATVPNYDLKAEHYDLSLTIGTNVQVGVADRAVAVRFVANGLDAYRPADEAEARRDEQLLSHASLPHQVRATVWGKVVGGAFEGTAPVLTIAPLRLSAVTYDFQGPGQPVFTATASP